MKCNLVWIFFLLVGALASPILAQQEAGDTELQLQGNLSISGSGGGSDSGGVNVLYGRFLTVRQEVGGMVNGFFTGNGDFGGIVGPFYRFNFSAEKLVPYVGAAATTSFGDFGNSEDDLFLTLEGGFRYFLDRRTAFSVQGQTYQSDHQDFGDQLSILIGFSRLWDR